LTIPLWVSKNDYPFDSDTDIDPDSIKKTLDKSMTTTVY
jgi:hypothetical protein